MSRSSSPVIWGDLGRYGEKRLSCEPLLVTCDMGRSGEIWGDEVEL